MKKLFFLGGGVMLSLFVSCVQEDTFSEQELMNPNGVLVDRPKNESHVQYSQTELIIQYEAGVTTEQKHQLRANHGITDENYRVCDRCPGKNIEMWNLEGLGIDPNDKKRSLTKGGAADDIISRVDLEFSFTNQPGVMNSNVRPTTNPNFSSKIIPSDDVRVSIAVLDSGLDPGQVDAFGSGSFLMDSSDPMVPYPHSGWDFVRNDDTPEHEGDIHGSEVTYFITRKLDILNVSYQILPVKVLDGNNRGSYFDILCGLQFALRKADIVNISLGWTDNNINLESIFYNILNDYTETKLVVVSGGNNENDNDITPYYPSSYSNPNLIGVAASYANHSDITDYSNYGAISLDFYARGNSNFAALGGAAKPVEGTSYAAPVVTAFAAQYISQHLGNPSMYTPSQIIAYLDNIGTPVNFTKPVKYGKLIN